MTGPNAKKKRAKLAREIEVEDGMGDEFGAFLSDLDRIGEVSAWSCFICCCVAVTSFMIIFCLLAGCVDAIVL